MAARQCKLRPLVLGKRERRGLESIERVTGVALVRIPGVFKLTAVRILVAIGTRRKSDLIACVLALGNMAFGAFNRGVFAGQRICAFLMHRNIEKRWLKRIVVMADAAIFFCELALVRVGIVAIGAALVCNRLREVARFMAPVAP